MGATYGDEALALLKRFDAWFELHGAVILSILAALVIAVVAVLYLRRKAPQPPGGPLL